MHPWFEDVKTGGAPYWTGGLAAFKIGGFFLPMKGKKQVVPQMFIDITWRIDLI